MAHRPPGRRPAVVGAWTLLILALAAPAAGAARVQLGASTRIVVPIGLTGEVRGLEATVPPVGAGGGTVVLAGSMPLALPAGRHASVRLPRGATLLGPAGALAVTEFTSSSARPGVLWEGSPDLAVGATIRLPGGLPPGRYVGSFDVTLEND